MMSICAIILTYNEEIHIARAIGSISAVVDKIIIIDSHSSDRTAVIATDMGASVVCNDFVNHASQLNFGIEHAKNLGFDWIFRLDADEFIDENLQREINRIRTSRTDYTAFTVNRYMTFMGDMVRYGGLFPVKVVRLFKATVSHCEQRWMDEHIITSGRIGKLDGQLIDDSLKSMTWWTQKHNDYASREAIELLLQTNRGKSVELHGQAKIKRMIKLYLYNQLPKFLRARLYYWYRMYLKLGILDKRKARKFHFFQAYWYRSLVDLKVHEVKNFQKREKCSLEVAIFKKLGIQI